jgi:Bifunctional DNA primase/polymerase, N-terminal
MGSVVSLRPSYAEQLGWEVSAYLDAGFKVVPLPFRSKAPKVKGWKDRTFVLADFRPDANVALRLDAGLTDIDFDWHEARDLGPAILPETAHFGRVSSDPGHALYTCAGLDKSIKYALPASVSEDQRFAGRDHALVVLEVRVDQSLMVPPSIHPSGEQLRWGPTQDVLEIDAADLQRRCGLVAVLSVVARCYPASGARNDVGIALSGALVRAGYSADEADAHTRWLAGYAGDEEADQRGAGHNAAKRIAEGKDVAGLPKLCELLGLPADVAGVFAKWLGQSEIDATTIILDNDREPENLDRMDEVFAASALPHYQRLGRRVHVVRQSSTGEEGKGRLVIRECSPRVIQQDIERLAKFAKWDGRRNAHASAQCPDRLAEMYMVKSDGWRVPELRGVRESPTLRGDGTILQTPGYDIKLGYLYDPRLAYPVIPEFPTKVEAEAALLELEHVLKDFNFASPADKAVALAGFIMSAIRPALETAPMIGIDAPQFGAGKTLLANLIHIVGHGLRPVAKGWAKDEAENEKRLFSSFMSGEPVYFVDNVAKDTPIGGGDGPHTTDLVGAEAGRQRAAGGIHASACDRDWCQPNIRRRPGAPVAEDPYRAGRRAT